jgi:hypothetical protein
MNLATTMLLTLAAQAAGPAPAPAGEAAWKVVCPPEAAGAAAQPCSLMQNLVAGDKQQRLLTVLLTRSRRSGKSSSGEFSPARRNVTFFPSPHEGPAAPNKKRRGRIVRNELHGYALGMKVQSLFGKYMKKWIGKDGANRNFLSRRRCRSAAGSRGHARVGVARGEVVVKLAGW